MSLILQTLGTIVDKIHENPAAFIVPCLGVVVLVLLFKDDTNSTNGRSHH